MLKLECDNILTEYEIERRKTFAEYIQLRENSFGEDGLSFEFYKEDINSKFAINELKVMFDNFLVLEDQIFQDKKTRKI